MVIVETTVFSRLIDALLPVEGLRSLQWALLLRPEQGALIKGASGLRKLRWSKAGGGKSGGVRILYYWAREEHRIYLVYAYSKTEKKDLTQDQVRKLGRFVREELK